MALEQSIEPIEATANSQSASAATQEATKEPEQPSAKTDGPASAPDDDQQSDEPETLREGAVPSPS